MYNLVNIVDTTEFSDYYTNDSIYPFHSYNEWTYDALCIYVDGMDIHCIYRHNVPIEWMDIKILSVCVLDGHP